MKESRYPLLNWLLAPFNARAPEPVAPPPPPPTHFHPLDPDLEPIPLPPFPEGLDMFFCIGAQKGGTSWLHDYLAEAPEIHFSPNKELHYFDVLAGEADLSLTIRLNALRVLADKLDTGATRLHKGFVERACAAAELLRIYTGKGNGPDRHAPYIDYITKGHRAEHRLVGDITPAYAILGRKDFADMASVGKARFIFIMRDPVARLWSHVRMTVAANPDQKTTPEALLEGCRAHVALLRDSDRLQRIERSDYLHTIRELEAVVTSQRILYVFFEDLMDGTATQEICDFLGIAHMPPNRKKRVNEGIPLPIPEDVETLFREALDPQYRGIRERFGAQVPARWRV